MRGSVAILGVLVAAGCGEERHVEILIGPDSTSVSRGYGCIADDNTSMPARAFFSHPSTPLVGDLDVRLVIDFVSLDGGVPGCRGEEIATWCSTHSCAPIIGQRWCGEIHLADMDFRSVNFLDLLQAQAQIQAIIAARIPEIYQQLHDQGNVTDDAPDVPVIVRGVATLEQCEDVLRLDATGHYPLFNLNDATPGDPNDPPAELVGCAYSCPVLFDEIDTNVSLSIDTTNVKCEPEVKACAGNLQFIPPD